MAKPAQQTCSLSIPEPICRHHQLCGPAELYFDDGNSVLVQIKQRCRSSEYEGSAEVAWIPVLSPSALPLPNLPRIRYLTWQVYFPICKIKIKESTSSAVRITE